MALDLETSVARRAERQRHCIKGQNARTRELFDELFASAISQTAAPERPHEEAADAVECCFWTFRAMSVEFGYVVLHPSFSFNDFRAELTSVDQRTIRRALDRLRDDLRQRKLQDRPAFLSVEDLKRAMTPDVPF